jgi:hypothetical protein
VPSADGPSEGEPTWHACSRSLLLGPKWPDSDGYALVRVPVLVRSDGLVELDQDPVGIGEEAEPLAA